MKGSVRFFYSHLTYSVMWVKRAFLGESADSLSKSKWLGEGGLQILVQAIESYRLWYCFLVDRGARGGYYVFFVYV